HAHSRDAAAQLDGYDTQPARIGGLKQTLPGTNPMTDSGEKRTVLVADDDPRLRNLLTWTLEQGQFNVVEAADGLSALETGRRIKPDLYLLDVGMPGMNGIEVCRQLRAEQVISPILILTGFGSEEDKVA